MKIKFYEFSAGRPVCGKAKRQEEAYSLKRKQSLPLKQAILIRNATNALISGELDEEETLDYMKGQALEIGFPVKEQAKAKADEWLNMAARYANCDQRIHEFGFPMDIEIAQDVHVTCCPSYIFRGDRRHHYIEVVKLVTGRPTLTQKAAGTDLQLYIMLLYGRKLAAESGISQPVRASFYFLKKNNDSLDDEHPNFDSDFFDTKGAGNIVTVEDYYDPAAKGAPTMKDMVMGPVVKRFLDEYEEEKQFDEKKCLHCPQYDFCGYATPAEREEEKKPAAKKGEAVKKKTFSPEQEEAIAQREGICLVSAAAGSGKSAVLTERLLQMLLEGTDPDTILCIMFTNSATDNIRERIGKILLENGSDIAPERLHILTMNSLEDKIIKREYKRFGFEEPPRVIDEMDAVIMAAEVLRKSAIPGINYSRFETVGLPKIMRVFSAFKSGLVSGREDVEALKEALESADVPYDRQAGDEGILEAFRYYKKYQEKLKGENFIEFADQEALVKSLLENWPDYLDRFGFSHIFVDEFQDTNRAQLGILQHLRKSPSWKSFFFVGDDFQSVYGFNGADPGIMVHLQECFPEDDIKTIKLERNYRSTQRILSCAGDVIKHNENQLDKTLVPVREEGVPVTVKGFIDRKKESEYVLDTVKKLIKGGKSPEDICLMDRTRSGAVTWAGKLADAGIPCQIKVPQPVYDNCRVKAAAGFVSYLDSKDTDEPDEEGLAKYINARLFGHLYDLDPETIKDVMEEGKELAGMFGDNNKEGDESEDDDGRKENCAKPGQSKEELLLDLFRMEDPEEKDECFTYFIKSLEGESMDQIFLRMRYAGIFKAASTYKLTGNYGGVTITTIHSSKGLEYDMVFVMTDGFKNYRPGSRAMEEEIRVAYVAATRAKNRLYVTGLYMKDTSKTAILAGESFEMNRILELFLESVGQLVMPSQVKAEIELEKEEKDALRKAKARKKRAARRKAG